MRIANSASLPGHGRRWWWAWLVIVALLMLLPMLAGGVRAAPPVFDIASEPLTAACRTAPGARIAGPALLLAAPAGPGAPPVAASPASPVGDLFSATLDASDWGGHFERIASPVSAAALWDASAILTGEPGRAPKPEPAARRLYTAIVQTDGKLVGIPFAWPALSSAQQALLDQAPPPHAAAADGLGERRLAYLRGDRSDEGTLFRRRTSVLGDSINSTPVLVGPPSGAARDAGYLAFRERHKARRATIYLGANDGMLHAFDANTGGELYAYFPNALMPVLNRLPSVDYVHRAYVDGPSFSADALIGANWRTVLVAAMGGGAQGVFALDISDPAALDENAALWEFTDRDDPMMGNVTTLPQLAKVRTSRGADVPTYRYFAIVSSGLNNYARDGHASGAGKGALFLLALDKPRDAPWTLNVNYFRLVTPISDPSLANGLSAPALLADRDGALSYAYAGDLQGNLWRFDFNTWPGAAAKALFVARDADGKRQPIAQQPMLAYASGGGYLILFGTGAMFDRAGLAAGSFSTQSFYAILDSLSVPMDVVAGRRQLTERVLDPLASDLLSISGAEMAPGSKGWYVDFLHAARTGERSINSGKLMGGEVVFNTLLPGADKCDASRGRTYVLDALSGLPGGHSTAAVMPSAPIVGVLQSTYAAVPSLVQLSTSSSPPDPTGRIVADKNYAVVNASARETTVVGSVKVRSRSGRLSWREVANWRELHEAIK
ncbi:MULTISPECIES: pilus assembly protein [unclassified Duganella]|uniref:pilus assembly protein n=1 Tax=unclassified Duganella TaxID=2636909 RepID=UPI000E34CE7A|nr:MULTISPECIES: PilC/PilY family type IV pilus protein [unclassified Duganella]RFP15783.1 pilus assembly protein PilY [Duganella sp. BJB475]RFP33052.1 pilus assembly protein PilY [Duganella sp. BJB476]